jgi:hypothetical protein
MIILIHFSPCPPSIGYRIYDPGRDCATCQRAGSTSSTHHLQAMFAASNSTKTDNLDGHNH